MTTVKFQEGIDILRLPVCEQEHIYQLWYMKYTQSHILHSKCSKIGLEDNSCIDDKNTCQFCLYVI
jgi:type 2A phosphatase activator TIP41